MERHDLRTTARRLLAIALVIGVLGEIVLDGAAAGINVPLMTGAMLLAAWLVRRPGRAPDPLDAWLPAGAIVLSRIDRVVYGAPDPKAGAAGSLFDVMRDRRLNHRPEVVHGVLAEECSAQLLAFFETQR